MIQLPRSYDFTFPGSYGSTRLDQRTSEITTVYSLEAPWVIVDVTGRVGVRVVPGTAHRISVRREVTWSLGYRGIEETWENGKTLRIRLGCPEDGGPEGAACQADYTLAVPAGVDVRLATPSGTVPCPPPASERDCRSPSFGETG